MQRDLSASFTLGAEVFRTTADTRQDQASAGFSIGGMVNLGERHHLLFSIGRDFSGNYQEYCYFAYQWTVAAPPGIAALFGRKPQ